MPGEETAYKEKEDTVNETVYEKKEDEDRVYDIMPDLNTNTRQKKKTKIKTRLEEVQSTSGE